MNAPSIIAIDGPAASGKSSLGQGLALQLGYRYLDTGVMYRAVGWAALSKDIILDDEVHVSALARELQIRILEPEVGSREGRIWAGEDEVTEALREEAVGQAASKVSEIKGVRDALTEQQRRIGEPGRIVMVGRDIGTVVLPRADLKIYLKASLEERAIRRKCQLAESGRFVTLKQAKASIRLRDLRDKQRANAPLKPAADAIVIDSTRLNAAQVLGMVWAILEFGPWNVAGGG